MEQQKRKLASEKWKRLGDESEKESQKVIEKRMQGKRRDTPTCIRPVQQRERTSDAKIEETKRREAQSKGEMGSDGGEGGKQGVRGQ